MHCLMAGRTSTCQILTPDSSQEYVDRDSYADLPKAHDLQPTPVILHDPVVGDRTLLFQTKHLIEIEP